MARTSTSSAEPLRDFCREVLKQEALLRQGGGKAGLERQRKLSRLPARERIGQLLDKDAQFFEIGVWAAYKMYEEWGNIVAAGTVAGIGNVHGVPCMIIANDASVKAGAFFPATVKKLLRAQRIAFECSLPITYRIEATLPGFSPANREATLFTGQTLAVDLILQVGEFSQSIEVTAAVELAESQSSSIGQVVDQEELGGAKMHSEISGTVDFYEKTDESCLKRLRSLVALLPEAKDGADSKIDKKNFKTAKTPDAVYDLVSLDGQKNYDARDLLATVVDSNSIDEYKADYGKTLVTAYAHIGGRPVGIVASQRLQVRTKKEGIQMGGVIYSDSADKAARFVMDCNQTGLPIIFFQDVTGFMVGRDAEQSGIIRSGAKLVNAVSNSVVPKITVVVGGSFGAGNYALCGKAYDPRFILAWPSARYAVMGAAQASDTVFSILARARDRGDKKASHEELDDLRKKVKQSYEEQTDIRYGAARGWVDAIVQPHETREALVQLLQYVSRPTPKARFHTGVIQV